MNMIDNSVICKADYLVHTTLQQLRSYEGQVHSNRIAGTYIRNEHWALKGNALLIIRGLIIDRYRVLLFEINIREFVTRPSHMLETIIER